MAQTLVVFSCDQRFFPLAKGLVLSLMRAQLERYDFGLAFIDLGCGEESLAWLRERGVLILSLDEGGFGGDGYFRAQTCRPRLPELFPGVDAFVWLDSDAWVQAPEAVVHLGKMALAARDKLFICPEWHYAYGNLNQNIVVQQVENVGSYYREAYDQATAKEMSVRPTLNSGVFSMAAKNPLWEKWRVELENAQGRDGGRLRPQTRHMLEQMALNLVAHRNACAVQVDPLYNFICMWGMPFRDENGLVRVPLPPGQTIAIVHLAQWKVLGKSYLEQGLLYERGEYLTAQERDGLLAMVSGQSAGEAKLRE